MTDRPSAARPAGTRRTPMTANEIQTATVGPIEPLTGPISFVEADPAWPALFTREEARIRAALRMVGFRDWLRTHDEDRTLYAATKHELLKQEWTSVQSYADAKTEVVETIMARAGLPGGRP